MSFWNFVGQVSNLAGAVGGVVSAIGILFLLRDKRRMGQEVGVLLRLETAEGQTAIRLPLALKRRDVSRAELLGRLGMLPMKQKGARFALRHLSSPTFMAAVNEVVEGRRSTLIVPCSQEEIDQFDL